MPVTSLRDFIQKNAPSRADIEANAGSAMQNMYVAAKGNFDMLGNARSIAASLSGVSKDALPAAALSEGRSNGWGVA